MKLRKSHYDLLDNSNLNLSRLSTPIANEIPSHALSEVATIDNCEKIPFLNEEVSLDTLLFDKNASKESFKGEDISNQEVSHVLKQIRVGNINRVIIGHLNVNFFAMKLDAIKTIIPGNVDIMVFGEAKLDDSHPIAQLLIEGFAKGRIYLVDSLISMNFVIK